MGHVNSDVAGFWVDSETGVLTEISGSTINVNPQGGQELLDDTGLGDSRHSMLPGLANATSVPANGYLDSTTEAIFAPLLDGTSVTKTIQVQFISGQYLSGEAWPEDVQLGSSIDALSTWSCTFTAEDGLDRTSQALS